MKRTDLGSQCASFPGGHPSKYLPKSTCLNFNERVAELALVELLSRLRELVRELLVVIDELRIMVVLLESLLFLTMMINCFSLTVLSRRVNFPPRRLAQSDLSVLTCH